jgi:hypothetical protein
MGRQAGPIRLRDGNEKFGKQHIEMRHGDGIRKRGYPSVEAFVWRVAQSFDAIYARRANAWTWY